MELIPVWEIYGLKSDPFAVQPITVSEGLIPKESFVGRKEELARIGKLFGSTGGTRVIITGPIGVGKTSFVNRARAVALSKNYFSPVSEIRVSSAWTEIDFIAETLASVYYSLKITTSPKAGTAKIIERLKPFFDQALDVRTGASISLIGTGAGYQPAPVLMTGMPTLTAYHNLFEETVRNLLACGYKQVIIHYNNFEEFEDQEEKLSRTVRTLRDFFTTPNVHFVFVSAKPLVPFLYRTKKFAEILSDAPIDLKPLSKREILEIIEARIRLLKSPGLNPINPVAEDSVGVLFDLYEGSLRWILNGLSTAVREVTNDRPVHLTAGLTQNILYHAAQRRFESDLTPKAGLVLNELLKRREATNKELGAALRIKSPNVSAYLKELQERNAIELVRVDGRHRHYAATNWARWLKLRPAEKETKQTALKTEE